MLLLLLSLMPSFSSISIASPYQPSPSHFHILRSAPLLLIFIVNLCLLVTIMRIRKGHRYLPQIPVDRGCLEDGGIPRVKDIQVVDDGKKNVIQASEGAAPVAATSAHQYLDHANGTSHAVTKHLEVDLEKRRLSADGYLKRRPLIIDGGVESAREKTTPILASADPIVTRHRQRVNNEANCSLSTSATKIKDQPNLLVQSLERVCSTAGNNGLSAREAVARLVEQGLPGLNEGGERLIVQVAKAFRNSSKFVEHEERGKYFIQDVAQLKLNSAVVTQVSNVSREQAGSSSAVIEAARQLQNLQRMQRMQRTHEAVCDGVGFAGRERTSETDHRVVALKGKGPMRASSSHKVSTMGDNFEPQCARDDGKGWRCSRPAEVGFSLCEYHRDQIRRAEIRRKKAKNKLEEQHFVKSHNPTYIYVEKACSVLKTVKRVGADCVESDDDMTDQNGRRFVKAKSLKSLL